jgi:5'-nucleotidase
VEILLSNDDGIEAPGLHALAAALRSLGRVTISAPDQPRSAASSSITLYEPVTAREVAPGCWAVSGTPADAVKLALRELLRKPPDLVVSGINNGLNTGANILYSGTVAAALEGVHSRITSFAVSRKVSGSDDFRAAARAAAKLIASIARRYPRASTVFNINLPPGKPRGVRVCAMELTPYDDRYDRRLDPRGRAYYWLRGTPPRAIERDGRITDDWAIARGFVTVTPLCRDLTDVSLLDELSHVLRRNGRRG